MKNIVLVLLAIFFTLSGCKEDKDWATGEINDEISIESLKFIYKGTDIVLSRDNMAGGIHIRGVVSCDYSKGNMPHGRISIQQNYRTRTAGIALDMGEYAPNVKLGDSILVRIEGKTLTREGGSIQVKNIMEEDLKILGNTSLEPIKVTAATLIANPGTYEAVLVSISNVLPNEPPADGQTYEGDLKVTDGSGIFTVRTNSGIPLASKKVSDNFASYTGVFFYETSGDGSPFPYIRMRSTSDLFEKYRILAWDFRAYNFTNDGPACPATVNSQYLEVSVLSCGSGTTPDRASSAFSAAWPISPDKEKALSNNEYFEFSIRPKEGVTLSLLSIDVKIRAHANGPQSYAWMYSTDEGAEFVQMGEDLAFIGQDLNVGFVQPTFDVSGISGVQEFTGPLTVRLYAWGATTAGRAFRLGQSNDETPYALSVEGVVQTN